MGTGKGDEDGHMIRLSLSLENPSGQTVRRSTVIEAETERANRHREERWRLPTAISRSAKGGIRPHRRAAASRICLPFPANLEARIAYTPASQPASQPGMKVVPHPSGAG